MSARQVSSEQAVMAALASRPDASTAAVADATGLGRSTVAKLLARLESQGRARRTRGERDGGRRRPDRWALTRPRTRRHSRSGRGERLRPGQLDSVVLDYLSGHSDPLTAGAVAKGIGRSSGALTNCLARLQAAGRARQVTERPRRYVAA